MTEVFLFCYSACVTNPFLYGQEVSGDDFCNRQKELAQFVDYVSSSNKVLLYSPRRWGKTSLIKEGIKRLPKNKFVVIYADLYPAIKEEDFNQIVASALAKSFRSPAQKALKLLTTLLRSFVPKLTLDPLGNAGFEFGFDSSRKPGELADELIDGISRYVLSSGKKGLVVFDEFQQIGEFPDDRLEKILRSKIQSQKNISYVFAGSKRHLLMEMFSDPSRPFYKSVIHFPVPPMPQDEIVEFIGKKMEKTGIKASGDVLSEIVAFTHTHPYYTQQLCFHLWDAAKEGKTAVTSSVVKTVIDRIVTIEGSSFQNVMSLLSRNQKIALKAIADLRFDEAPFSNLFMKRVGITTADSFRKSLESLVLKGLIEKEEGVYVIYDVFFKEWLRRN
ncbi:MAG: ATP-binding protein [Deltaproteobacteria bacterium]|nr:ATP-binding protein [Deltaproteobacteria bacterium]